MTKYTDLEFLYALLLEFHGKVVKADRQGNDIGVTIELDFHPSHQKPCKLYWINLSPDHQYRSYYANSIARPRNEA